LTSEEVRKPPIRNRVRGRERRGIDVFTCIFRHLGLGGKIKEFFQISKKKGGEGGKN